MHKLFQLLLKSLRKCDMLYTTRSDICRAGCKYASARQEKRAVKLFVNSDPKGAGLRACAFGIPLFSDRPKHARQAVCNAAIPSERFCSSCLYTKPPLPYGCTAAPRSPACHPQCTGTLPEPLDPLSLQPQPAHGFLILQNTVYDLMGECLPSMCAPPFFRVLFRRPGAVAAAPGL